MRKGLKAIANRSVKPFLQWYLRRPRMYSHNGIRIEVPPGVFHPGFFFSSKQLAHFLGTLDLHSKELLEIGCGSGFVSIAAAKRSANVTCTDLSPAAVNATKKNAAANSVKMEILQSDLFAAVPQKKYDFIAVNPPYYPRNPETVEEHAWYAGEDFSYFKRFFRDAKNFVCAGTQLLMVLSDECNLDAIRAIAEKENWKWTLASTQKTFFETGYIIMITPSLG